MKKILTTILAAALGLSSWGATVAKIGETGYETLQAAIDAAHDMPLDDAVFLLHAAHLRSPPAIGDRRLAARATFFSLVRFLTAA